MILTATIILLQLTNSSLVHSSLSAFASQLLFQVKRRESVRLRSIQSQLIFTPSSHCYHPPSKADSPSANSPNWLLGAAGGHRAWLKHLTDANIFFFRSYHYDLIWRKSCDYNQPDRGRPCRWSSAALLGCCSRRDPA